MKSFDPSFPSIDNLQVLPSYACYLLSHKLDEYCQKQIQISFEINIPLLKFYSSFSKEELFIITKNSAIEFLTPLSENKTSQYIADSMERWKANHIPGLDKRSIQAEDITLFTYLRKKVLLFFLPSYTNDTQRVLSLVEEIDFVQTTNLNIATNTYMDLLREGLVDYTHFIEKVNETIPGAIHVFDRNEHKGIYSNKKLSAIVGYEQSELNAMDTQTFASIIHPEDMNRLKEQASTMAHAKDGETTICKYRVKDKNGVYKWLAGHEAVFKRNEDGTVWQTIGITMDIDNEQKAIAEKQRLIKSLSRSEALYKKAEEIANMGNWVWYLKKQKLEWTDQLFRIYGLEPQSEEITIERFLSFIHPDDYNYVKEGVKDLDQEQNLDYIFRIITTDGTIKWLRSIAQIIRDKDGEISTIIGIEQDVTEKQKLINKLEESQGLYKQAQSLSKMGNFTWDLKSNEVFWSEEVFNIYEKSTADKVRFEDILLPIVDEHKEGVQKAIEAVLKNKEGKNISYAIRKKDGSRKYINFHTDVRLNDDDNVGCLIGTVQDITEKEELIDRLKESEKLYKQAQALAHLGNWTFDFITQAVTWSDELYSIYEREYGSPLTPEEWNSYIDPRDKIRVEQHLADSIRDKKPLDIVHKIHLHNGKTKVLHRRGEVIFDLQGKPVRLVGTTQEITKQYQVQADLEESQIFIRKITDATPSIIDTYNVTNGEYTFISEGVEKLLGYSTTQLMDNGVSFFTDLIHPDDKGKFLEANKAALEKANANGTRTDILFETSYRIKHNNGKYRWLHTYGTIFDYSEKGEVEHVLNISLDVTEQREATEKIKEQEHFIQQIADASPTILYLFDVTSQSMSYINREAFFVLGYLPDEILEEGSNITDYLYHPEDIPLLPCRKQSDKTFQQVDSMIQYECRLKHKDGEYRWLLVREIVFKTDDEGNIMQIIGAALDINRRKEMERTILQNTLQLEQSNASLEEFAYVASHDLKEPLRKISTFGDRLMASQVDRLNDDGKIYLSKIVDASQRMQNMISDLLSISMISGNRSFEPYSLQKILEETLQTLEYKIENAGAVIRYPSLPEISIVPSQFRQLFQNLLSNSLKFVREDVQPVISITCSEADEVEVAPFGLAKAETYFRITFSDNGIGFENEYAQKIFAIFQRLHGRSEYEGSGIGLSICKKIVEHHRGIIFAKGTPGEGATFTIILPA